MAADTVQGTFICNILGNCHSSFWVLVVPILYGSENQTSQRLNIYSKLAASKGQRWDLNSGKLALNSHIIWPALYLLSIPSLLY
jgi:hypothetical protein